MRRPCSLLTRCLAGALALLFAPDCTGQGGAALPGSADGTGGAGGDGTLNTPDGVVLSAAVWTFAWDTEGAVFPAGGGLEVETDLGYRVHVDEGRILSHSVSFGPCDTAAGTGSAGAGGAAGGTQARLRSDDRWAPGSAGARVGKDSFQAGIPAGRRSDDRWAPGSAGASVGKDSFAAGTLAGRPLDEGWLSGQGGTWPARETSFGLPGWVRRLVVEGLPVRTARAHTADTDPSMIETSLIEDLTAPVEAEASTSFAASRYCRAHWLLARAMTPTTGPDDVPMDHRSLYVTGTFERDGKVEPFVIDTWWPEGSLQDLGDILGEEAFSAAREDGEARHAFVTVRRSLGTLFDGIDFEVASKDQVAGRAIDNLAGSVQFEAVLWTPGDSP